MVLAAVLRHCACVARLTLLHMWEERGVCKSGQVSACAGCPQCTARGWMSCPAWLSPLCPRPTVLLPCGRPHLDFGQAQALRWRRAVNAQGPLHQRHQHRVGPPKPLPRACVQVADRDCTQHTRMQENEGTAGSGASVQKRGRGRSPRLATLGLHTSTTHSQLVPRTTLASPLTATPPTHPTRA